MVKLIKDQIVFLKTRSTLSFSVPISFSSNYIIYYLWQSLFHNRNQEQNLPFSNFKDCSDADLSFSIEMMTV